MRTYPWAVLLLCRLSSAGRGSGELYALAEGGTLLFPKSEGTLRSGAYASRGLGVDNAR